MVTKKDRMSPQGLATLKDRYYYLGESTPEDLFRRVANAYGHNSDHSDRIFKYMMNGWFMPATPILSNGGTDRGLPISCYLNKVNDSLDSILSIWDENAWLSSRGGGIGTDWSNVRSISEKVGKVGESSGVIPFIRVQDSVTLAISQGSLRRGSSAVYLDVSHPEIEEFIEIRRPTGGDINRKSLNIHHGVCIPDKFMEAVVNDSDYDLVSPATGKTIKTVKARDLWIRILTARLETGEPYLYFTDTVKKNTPSHHKNLGLFPTQSNLCTEITLPTGTDHLGNERTAVCCLSSLNLRYYDEWKNHAEQFIEDVMRFLDKVLDDFIEQAKARVDLGEKFNKAIYSVMRERSIGLGVMGLHDYFQHKNIPWESALAKGVNINIFKTIDSITKNVNIKLARELGSCLDAIDTGEEKRFSYVTAIAPTSSISVICGNSSPGVEPRIANCYNHKTLGGSFFVKNDLLAEVLEKYGKDTEETWSSINSNVGSVQHLSFLSDDEKAVFKTAQEINQRWIIEFAGDRQKYIDQAQSINIFLPPTIHKTDLQMLHFLAWRLGMKSLYYCRSSSLNRAEIDPIKNDRAGYYVPSIYQGKPSAYEECLACQ